MAAEGDMPDAKIFGLRAGVAAPVLGEIDPAGSYNMSHKSRGVAVIINNDEFQPKTGMGARQGSKLDRDNLIKTFKHLGFTDIRVKDNITYRAMVSLLEDIADEDFTERDCFACAILSHGEENYIYGVDDKVALEDLYKPFRGNVAPTLAGKPKLFFLQACRGVQLDDGALASDAIPNTKKKSESKSYRIASESDFLMAYSVVPGYYAWRNCRNGSWFIQSLCDILVRYGLQIDLLRCLTRVNKQVSYVYQSNAAAVSMTEKKQSPSVVTQLTKELFFGSGV